MIFSSCIALSSQRDSTSFFEYGGDRTGDSQDGAFIRFKQRTRLYVSVSRTKLTIYNDKGDDLSVDFRAPSVIKDVYMSTPDGDWTKVRFRLRRCTYHEFSLKILFFLYWKKNMILSDPVKNNVKNGSRSRAIANGHFFQKRFTGRSSWEQTS